MHKTFASATLASAAMAALLAIPVGAQTAPQGQTDAQPTAAELLQKGIYAQETSGDLETAAKIYRQIVDSHPVQREIAAQAQYRLGMTLLQKGDAALASQEIQRLGWDFPDYKDLIASAKNASGKRTITFTGAVHPAEADVQRAEVDSLKRLVEQGRDVTTLNVPLKFYVTGLAQFDSTKTVTQTGAVSQINMSNPAAWLTLASGFRVRLNSPGALAAQGWNTDAVKLGDMVTVVGSPALDGSQTIGATSVSKDGKVLWSVSAMK